MNKGYEASPWATLAVNGSSHQGCVRVHELWFVSLFLCGGMGGTMSFISTENQGCRQLMLKTCKRVTVPVLGTGSGNWRAYGPSQVQWPTWLDGKWFIHPTNVYVYGKCLWKGPPSTVFHKCMTSCTGLFLIDTFCPDYCFCLILMTLDDLVFSRKIVVVLRSRRAQPSVSLFSSHLCWRPDCLS